MLWLVPVSVSVSVASDDASVLDAAAYLYFNHGGQIPLRTAAHSFCIELKHIMSAPTLPTDCACLCLAAPAVGASPWKSRSLWQGSVCLSLPPLPILCPLPALWPAEEVALLPRYESSLLPIVFLASKLQRLIFCDRSNLSGKAEVHTESAPLNFPKPLQSFHNVSLYWMQQRDSCLKKATKIYS